MTADDLVESYLSDVARTMRTGPAPPPAADLALLTTLVGRGRWEPLTRRTDIALSLATCAAPPAN